MSKILEQISESLSLKFGVSKDDVISKLGLTQESKYSDIAKALGGYAIFESKDNLTSYINENIKNIYEKVETDKNDLLAKHSQELSQAKDISKKLLQEQFKEFNPSGDLPFDKIDFNKFDFQNVKGELVKIGKENNLITKPEANKDLKNPNSSTIYSAMGNKIEGSTSM